MGYPELSSTLERPVGSRRSRAAPQEHQHEWAAASAPEDGPEAALVALALAVQDGCQECVEQRAAAAAAMQVPRLQLVEALGTALLLSAPHADRWPRLAEAALTAHAQGFP